LAAFLGDKAWKFPVAAKAFLFFFRRLRSTKILHWVVESNKFNNMSLTTKSELSAIAKQDAASLAVEQNGLSSSDAVKGELQAAASPSSFSDASMESINPRKRKHSLEDKDQKQRER
jgi:hypothetical protein